MASTTFEKPLDNDVSAISTNLGSPSSASAVTGADAFSKINTLNSNLTNLNNNKANVFNTGWGTTLNVNCHTATSYVLVNNNTKIQVWIPSTNDVSVTVYSYSGNTAYAFSKSGTGSITFGEDSASGTSFTIQRTGNLSYTITRATSATMIAFA